MKRIFKLSTMLVATIVLASAIVSCGEKYTTVKGDPTATRIYTLDNGLTVYLSVVKKEPRIQTYVAVRTGSKNDPAETTGLSHYLEHLMFKGTKSFGTTNYEAEKPYLDRITEEFEKYRTLTDPEERKAQYALIDSLSYEASQYFIGNEYDKIMAQMGAKGSNAFTSFDMTVYTEDIPSNMVEAWAKIQSDRFKNMVIRGFHTELEAVYEECNLSLSNDGGNAVDTLLFAMFDKHPYGLQTTIGTQEHLKNPSIVNIQNHFNNFYVPNNVAICMAGDFNPDEVIKVIKQYFGDWQKNDNIKLLEFEDEEPINEHIEKTVYGLESPFVMVGWRFPSAYRANKEGINYTEDTLYMVKNILFNGVAGLVDLDINRPHKTLGSAAYTYELTDYTLFFAESEPREGQTLEEAKQLVFDEIEKIKKGEFDESMITSILNNLKKQKMQMQDSYRAIASMQYEAFINHLPWEYVVNQVERLEKITKDDIVAFAKRNFNDNYVQVNKVVGPQVGVKTLEKPAITAIRTNRDTSSQFLRDIEEFINAAKPIEPVFVDYKKDMSVDTLSNGQLFYYKHNDDNELAQINYYFTNGSNDNRLLPYAISYVNALGTDSLSNEELRTKLYALAANVGISDSPNDVTAFVSGLSSTLDDACAIFEDMVKNVKGDEQLLAVMKQNWMLEKFNAKTDKRSNENAVMMYAAYGPENSLTTDLKPLEIAMLTSDQLIDAVKDLFRHKHDIVYYGPLSKDEIKAKIADLHKVDENLAEFGPSRIFNPWNSSVARVFVAPYKANQINLYKVTTYDDKEYNAENDAFTKLYDTYFGSGMSSIVFQDLREAKGLAYHASAFTTLPSRKGEVPYYLARIYTQNDKMLDAMKAFDEILTDMPVAQKSFDVAKANTLQNLATRRYNGIDVIWHYIALNEKGVSLDYDKKLYEKISSLNLDDIVNYQKNNIKGRAYNTGILGNIPELKLKDIAPSYGKVNILKTEDIFGY